MPSAGRVGRKLEVAMSSVIVFWKAGLKNKGQRPKNRTLELRHGEQTSPQDPILALGSSVGTPLPLLRLWLESMSTINWHLPRALLTTEQQRHLPPAYREIEPHAAGNVDLQQPLREFRVE